MAGGAVSCSGRWLPGTWSDVITPSRRGGCQTLLAEPGADLGGGGAGRHDDAERARHGLPLRHVDREDEQGHDEDTDAVPGREGRSAQGRLGRELRQALCEAGAVSM